MMLVSSRVEQVTRDVRLQQSNQRMLDAQSIGFLTYYARAQTRRTVMMIVLLVLSRLSEAVGLVTLLPLLELGVGSQSGEGSRLSRWVADILALVDLPTTLPVLLGLIVVAMLAKAVFYWLAMREVGYTVAQVATDLRLRLIRSVMGARWRHFASRPAGNFSNAVSSEANRAANAFKQGCNAFADAIQIIIYLGVIASVSWKVGLVGLFLGGFVLWGFRRFVDMSRQAGNRQTEMMQSLVARLTDTLPGLKAIKAMGRERYLLPLLEQETEEINEAQRGQVLASETVRAFQEPGLVLIIAVGIFLGMRAGDLAFSTVSILALLAYRVMTTLGNVQRMYQAMTVGESAFWSLMEEIRLAEERPEPDTGHQSPPPLTDGIRFEGVSFAYEDETVLKDVRLSIPAKRFTAITGPSGAGKTTFIDLIVGLYQPDDGRILVDGVPLPEIDLGQWRRRIGYVPQEMLLFHDTVLRNVTLGDDSITRDEARRALSRAGAWEFVERLPEGLDQRIGERGSNLSGGQRQRIAIARALVGDPDLLLLDEATTALNPEIEREICRNLQNLSESVTVLSISHQPAMVDAADLVYRVENGVVEPVERSAAAAWS